MTSSIDFTKALFSCLLAGLLSSISFPALCFAQSEKQILTSHTTDGVITATPQRITATLPQPSPKLTITAPWKKLEPGLEHASFALQNTKAPKANLEVLRFDPKYFQFVLHSISEKGCSPQTLSQWASEADTVAAINASMYLPDGRTSTGYMRSGTHQNNKHIAKSFGAFFLAEPTKTHLAPAKLLEKDQPNTLETLDDYAIVIQNFRLINSNREILWSKGGQKHSIAAVGEDGQGNILFLHCRQPIEAYTFAQELLRLPLDVRTVMYVEGGAQAGMVLRQNNESTFWGGRHPADVLLGSVAVALPNILGVRRKKTTN